MTASKTIVGAENVGIKALSTRSGCFLNSRYLTVKFSGTRVDGVECDIFLPSMRLAIEIDGYPWHDSENARARQKKAQNLNDMGIKLFGTEILSETLTTLTHNICMKAISFRLSSNF